jgi:SPP1 gp7 family putative phage head morphogenesis protein
MARAVVLSTDRGLREFSVATLAGDKQLAKAVAKAQRANVELVKDVATQVRDQIASVLAEHPGVRWEDIASKIQERVSVGESRAELIARDQVLSTNGEIVAIRQKAAGVKSYVWSTSLDERVRDDHAEREGQEFDWNGPPEDGNPGEPILCRCVAIPILPEE